MWSKGGGGGGCWRKEICGDDPVKDKKNLKLFTLL